MEDHVLRKTPLREWHTAHQAKLAPFGGYEMPLWYASAKNEHLAVLTNAGLFDTSHMAILTVEGPDAFDLLQYCFTKDLSACVGARQDPLYPGRCVYGAFLDDHGFAIDDAIIFMSAPKKYMIVVNAGMGPTIADHLRANRAGRLLTITDWSDQVGKIDLQGPRSVAILYSVLQDAEKIFSKMPYFSFKGDWRRTGAAETVVFKNGTPAMISRTGYTGEIGFEIFCPPDQTVRLWELLFLSGGPLGLVPCGLASRDSLRTGALLPLSHQDIGGWLYANHPWPFALPFTADRNGFTKTFIGAQAVSKSQNAPRTLPFVGFDVRKVGTAFAVVKSTVGQDIGKVLTCTTDMGIGRHEGKVLSIASPERPADWSPKGLCCGFLMVNQPLEIGTRVELHDQRRSVEAEIRTDIRPARTARRALQDFLRL
jgi:aminomethyltransferase